MTRVHLDLVRKPILAARAAVNANPPPSTDLHPAKTKEKRYAISDAASLRHPAAAAAAAAAGVLVVVVVDGSVGFVESVLFFSNYFASFFFFLLFTGAQVPARAL